MAQLHPTIQCDDVPLDEARRMSRGPRMTPEISNALKQNSQYSGNAATRVTISDGAKPTTGKTISSGTLHTLGTWSRHSPLDHATIWGLSSYLWGSSARFSTPLVRPMTMCALDSKVNRQRVPIATSSCWTIPTYLPVCPNFGEHDTCEIDPSSDDRNGS
jgi:hypothetical protein